MNAVKRCLLLIFVPWLFAACAPPRPLGVTQVPLPSLTLPPSATPFLPVPPTKTAAPPTAQRPTGSPASVTLQGTDTLLTPSPAQVQLEPLVDASETPLPPSAAVPPADPPVRCEPPNGRGHWMIYILRAGDTLSSLAQQTGTSTEEIRQANCLAGELVFAGQRLYLPSNPVPPSDGPASATEPPPDGVGGGPTGDDLTPPAPGITETIEVPATPNPGDPPQTVTGPSEPSVPAPTTTDTIEIPVAPNPSDPMLDISPSSGPPETRFTIRMVDFAPGEALRVYIIAPDDAETLLEATTDAQGAAVVTFTAPANALAGLYLVEALNSQGEAFPGEFEITSSP